MYDCRADVNKSKGPLNCRSKHSKGIIPPEPPRKPWHLLPLNITLLPEKRKKKNPDDSNLLLCECKEVLQEHPDLSSTSFYSQAACVLPAPLVQTPHPSRRASHSSLVPRQNQGRHRLMLCVFSCVSVCFVLRRWSVAPTKRCSRAWNHLSSGLKGLHGFLMMSPNLLCAKYTQWLHSFRCIFNSKKEDGL